MTNWTDRYHYTTPRQGWSPLKQSWEDREGKAVSNWTEWKAKEEG